MPCRSDELLHEEGGDSCYVRRGAILFFCLLRWIVLIKRGHKKKPAYEADFLIVDDIVLFLEISILFFGWSA